MAGAAQKPADAVEGAPLDKDKLWKMADALRGSLDAAEYKTK